MNQVIPIYLVSLTFILMFLFAPLFVLTFQAGIYMPVTKKDNRNRMRRSGLALEKYRVTQSGYFRLATTVALGVGNKDGKLL